ncbi:uncharacterized protein LOC106142604 isoform X1 [Amyelois transitella]|uniref:uncharacterized protein LOC106142604 isoform X1 n=1 Tax=Amyelois transitella TaxID=680683 RepID=UPI00298FA30A|nr:uncharacterized protein LOC106142604 isoform X1 [Amyelois transitella]
MQRGRLLVGLATKTTGHQEKENDDTLPSLSSLVSTNNESVSQREDSDIAKEQSTHSLPSPSTSNQVLQEIDVNSSPNLVSNVESVTECNQKKYYISPLHSDQSDFDDSDHDPHFIPNSQSPSKTPSLLRGRPTIDRSSSSSSSGSSSRSSSSSSGSSSSSSSSSSTDNRVVDNLSPIAGTSGLTAESNDNSDEQYKSKGKKRARKVETWKHNVAKRLRNTGKAYESTSKKQVPARKMGPTCGEKCRLKCSLKINETSRLDIFNKYWNLGDLRKQREFIIRHSTSIKPKYRYSSTQNFRKLNTAFHFQVNDDHIRVCKTFFKNTLAINDRPIATALAKKTESGLIDEELRGKHGKQRTIEPEVYDGVKNFINAIPRVESHYLRAQTSREYIQGDKSLADLYRDYKSKCTEQDLPFSSASTFNRIFNKDFNISFHTPKKDQCDFCESFKNADEDGKNNIIEVYETHLREKELSRKEKEKDKTAKIDSTIVAVYDLQAVMPIPKGQISLFYYKSRINCFNFTVSDLYAKNVECYFWDETEGKRGANEIESCILNYIEQMIQVHPGKELDFIFYSDNCCGQQKNKYLLTAYAYAVQKMKVKSVTHKFLIRGHSQNEGDNVHSVIEKQVKRFLKSGPIYVPQQYITLIQTAKKTGKPYRVTEMTYDKFRNLNPFLTTVPIWEHLFFEGR